MLLVVALVSLASASAQAGERATVRFAAESQIGPPVGLVAPPPSFEGKVLVRGEDGVWRSRVRVAPAVAPPTALAPMPAGDLYLQDGSETALAVDSEDADLLLGSFNESWNFDPDIPHGVSSDGNASWSSRSFPEGGGTFTGAPFDPWASAGNSAGVFYSTQIRRDGGATGNAHVVVARSTDGGESFSLFFERVKPVFQDRSMVDVDRTLTGGGGPGSAHDGTLYVAYDDIGAGGVGYVGSFLQVVSPSGSASMEIQISGSGSPLFWGSQIQPVAGVADGVVHLLSAACGGTPTCATRTAYFHEITNGGSGPNTIAKSALTWDSAGQQLGSTKRFGLNGHRIDAHGQLAIDRSAGERRGHLYFVSNRNPNPADASMDQGDVHLSVSTDGATTWSTAPIPTAEGKTQYFPMLDVGDDGWIYVAYYQNETGTVDSGVLDASTANLYFTYSDDGGVSWSIPVQVNASANALDMVDPPLDLADVAYYLIGDYAQIRARGSGAGKRVYILWTGYDKDRGDVFVGDAKERVLCTSLSGFATTSPVPSLARGGLTALVLALALVSAIPAGGLGSKMGRKSKSRSAVRISW